MKNYEHGDVVVFTREPRFDDSPHPNLSTPGGLQEWKFREFRINLVDMNNREDGRHTVVSPLDRSSSGWIVMKEDLDLYEEVDADAAIRSIKESAQRSRDANDAGA